MPTIRTHEREITSRTRIATKRGRINHDAVGFARIPLFDGTIPSFGRRKRWEYWCVTSRTHALSITYADLDVVRLASAWFVDLETDERIEVSLPLPPLVGTKLAPTVAGGDVVVDAGLFSFAIREQPNATRLETSFRTPMHRLDAEVVVAKPEGHESLNVVVPFDDERFQLTSKHVARPARGLVVVDGRVHRFDDRNESFGALDFGRGIFPAHTTWNWSAAAGVVGDRVVGWNLGGKWTDGTGVTENGVFVDGRLHKLGADVRFEYDRAHPARTWRIASSCGCVDLELSPKHVKQVDALGAKLGAKLDLAFGTFRGRLYTEEGEAIEVRETVGWAEDFEARW